MKKNVLIVEDDVILNDELKETLLDEGYCVDSVFDVSETLKLLLKSCYDVILLDLKIPGDGFSILKKKDIVDKTKIFVMTGSSIDQLNQQQKNLLKKAQGVLVKPFDIGKLLSEINDL